ncbi:unnamed protein product [Soboliphyme baturini]|uniref:Uncharacterized protein n=1 Tax=Soboliphyme baturini TaxID=241478 RepID=A0A183IVZ7_9BILA|nr:unnamed protein product [Soboliphyme baturini]
MCGAYGEAWPLLVVCRRRLRRCPFAHADGHAHPPEHHVHRFHSYDYGTARHTSTVTSGGRLGRDAAPHGNFGYVTKVHGSSAVPGEAFGAVAHAVCVTATNGCVRFCFDAEQVADGTPSGSEPSSGHGGQRQWRKRSLMRGKTSSQKMRNGDEPKRDGTHFLTVAKDRELVHNR